MTHKAGNTVVIESTSPAHCSECGVKRELRPYGKGGAWVCFTCGMKDEEEVERQIGKLFNDDREI